MKSISPYLKWIIYGVFFVLHFTYFIAFSSFHLLFLEQIQLFRFDYGWFCSFFTSPGGMVTYLGEFVTQFFTNGWIAALIITFLSALLFILTDQFLKKLHCPGVIWRLLPIFALVYFPSNYHYQLANTIGLIMVLGLWLAYASVKKKSIRYLAGCLGWIAFFPLLGGFALWLLLLMLLYELLFGKDAIRWTMIGIYLFIGTMVPFLFFRFVWFIDLPHAWLASLPFFGESSIESFILLLMLFPLMILFAKYRTKFFPKSNYLTWNWENASMGIVICLACAFGVKKYGYDSKTEILLGIDHYVQTSRWEDALKLSKEYPGTNRLIMYYTNLALYKTGRMADELFSYNQSGSKGLWLEWKRNEVTPFVGSELFYQLGYTSEASRWAFESMVLRGVNPRSLKRLVQTSIITRDYAVAAKYLAILKQTWHYRSLAQQYNHYLTDTTLILQNKELMEKRRLLPQTDFLSDATNKDIGLLSLLENHPDNRMAFEYLMSALLLTKNLEAFAIQVQHLKDFGYSQIPIHYEEALLFYMGFTRKNFVPEGFVIRESTRENLKSYAQAYSMSSSNPAALFKTFGNTYWFYLQFVKNAN